jgi:lipopolysaccharide/colanic/teichoic acid biosynthesis glycosyltransferase
MALQQSVYERFGKRGFDIFAAGLTVIVAAPLMLIVALVIRLESSGPIFFRQERVGRHKQRFSIIKFRTMLHRPTNAIDQHSEQVTSSGMDPRITKNGRLLRRLSLDELPQIFNVLKGEMSLVGPRPILPEQLEAMGIEADDRFKVRPGITGLSQISGRRALSWPQQLARDVEYACNISLAMDLTIMFRTISVVWSGSGLYGTEEDNWRRYIRRHDEG